MAENGLKPLWDAPPVPTQDLSGDLASVRSNDPNAEGGDGPNGLNPLWDSPTVSTPGGSESSNSESGLPSLPRRYTPSGEPPAPPSLQDRSPGTIDQQ